MRLLIAALSVLPISAAAAEPARDAPQQPTRLVQLEAKKECPKPLAHWAGPDQRPELRPEFRKLTELPPADAFHAVYRVDGDGCLDPVMVGYQYGRRR